MFNILKMLYIAGGDFFLHIRTRNNKFQQVFVIVTDTSTSTSIIFCLNFIEIELVEKILAWFKYNIP